MDRRSEVLEITKRTIPNTEKIHLLAEICLDLKNEMNAQYQNTQPKVHDELEEAFRLANNCLIKLRTILQN